jgi:alpha-L-fucosidase
MPNGKIQPEFTDTLQKIGKWLQVYGPTIYATEGNIIAPQKWGVVTAANNKWYVHITGMPDQKTVVLPGINKKISSAVLFNTQQKVSVTQTTQGLEVDLSGVKADDMDTVVQLSL